MWVRYLLLTLIIGALPLTTPCAGEARGRGGISHGGGHGSHHVVDVPRHLRVHVPLRVPRDVAPFVRSPVRPFPLRVPRDVGPFAASRVDSFPLRGQRGVAPFVTGPVDPFLVSPDIGSPDVPFDVSPPVPDIAIPEIPAPPELPATRRAAPPVRRDVPVADSKIVLPPPPMPPGPPCSHTVVIYRGSKAEVQSFPISPCPAAKRPG
jgi:hypothetical protein